MNNAPSGSIGRENAAPVPAEPSINAVVDAHQAALALGADAQRVAAETRATARAARERVALEIRLYVTRAYGSVAAFAREVETRKKIAAKTVLNSLSSEFSGPVLGACIDVIVADGAHRAPIRCAA